METLIDHLQHALVEQIRQELPTASTTFNRGEITVSGELQYNIVYIYLRLTGGNLELKCYTTYGVCHIRHPRQYYIPLADPECFTRVIECVRYYIMQKEA